MNDVTRTLEDRERKYGSFEGRAEFLQKLKAQAREQAGWGKLTWGQAQAVDMIFDKLSRILNGRSTSDSWHDIQGYAKLAEDPEPPVAFFTIGDDIEVTTVRLVAAQHFGSLPQALQVFHLPHPAVQKLHIEGLFDGLETMPSVPEPGKDFLVEIPAGHSYLHLYDALTESSETT